MMTNMDGTKQEPTNLEGPWILLTIIDPSLCHWNVIACHQH
jgi:hypothetical protein